MQFDSTLFFSAIGLALIFEGLPYLLFAERMRNILLSLAENPPTVLRGMGILGIVVGLFVIWLARA